VILYAGMPVLFGCKTMWLDFPIFPEQASTLAPRVDALYFFLTAVSTLFAGLIFLLLFYFAVKYRRRSETEQPLPMVGALRLELAWTLIPLALTMVMFLWGASLYFTTMRPPENAVEIYVVGKQWMWYFQHPEGRREIDELHVPVGRPVKLVMTSQDVIHSFYVPAFRIKMDVVPGRYTTTWFEATKTGEYHLFCAEYCGTAHAGMGGRVHVMKPTQYEQWLGGGIGGEPMSMAGERLFEQLGCGSCHRADAGGLGPVLRGLFGTPVRLQSGERIIADERYIRESILNPWAQIVEGYPPLMPPYEGQISEEGLLQIIAYIKSLAQANGR
jgi:cytochrome c oxidase subunit II